MPTCATAKNAGESITGTDAVLIDGGANDLQDTIFGTTTVIANNTSTNDELARTSPSHGDDFLLGGNGNDTINAGTGDDRVEGSTGTDAVDGGKNYYAVKVLGEAQSPRLCPEQVGSCQPEQGHGAQR